MEFEQQPDGLGEQGFTPVELGTPTVPEMILAPEDEPDPRPDLAPANQRQQDKMINCLRLGNSAFIDDQTFELEEETRKRWTRELGNEVQTPEKVSEFLGYIAPPVVYEADPANPVDLFEQVVSDKVTPEQVETQDQKTGILAHFSGLDTNARYQVTAADLSRFLHEYPDPASFEPAAAMFMKDQVASKNTAEQLTQYEQSMRAFKYTVYGKRQEYWEQFQRVFGSDMQRADWRKAWSPKQKPAEAR